LQSGAKKQKLHDDDPGTGVATAKSGMMTSIVFVNGFVLAVVVFLILHFTVGDIRAQEMRRVTRDVVRMTEEAVRQSEKTVTALAHFYAAVREDNHEDIYVAESVQKLLTEGAPLDAILWATSNDTWYQEDIQNKTRYQVYRANLGWPGYQDLLRLTKNLAPGQIGYIYQAEWPIFQRATSTPEEAPVGMVVKMQLPGQGLGIFMALTTPGKIFAETWQVHAEDISRVMIRERDSGHVLIDKRFWSQLSSLSSFATERVTDTLSLAGQYWDIHVDVQPSGVAKALSASPWAALAVILMITLLAARMAERRQRQEMKLAEMSRTLKGAHTELQSRITERDQLFHALRKSEREYRAVINSVSDVIFETDETGKLVFLNETWKRITHNEVVDTIGQSLFLLIDQQDQVAQKEMFEELVRGERQAYRIETRLSLGHNMVKPVEIAFSMLRMAEDKSIRVVGTITDIEKRRRAELAVREAEQRFRGMFENSVSGIYQIAPEGRFISANPAMAEILGYRSAAEMMENMKDIASIYINPEDRKSFVDKLLFEGRVSGVETQVMRKDGQKIWVMENARVVRNERGSVEYFEGSIWDVTERKEAEAAMNNARLQAEISSRTRMEFLANMSHELRTPLNAVIGFSEIIKDEVMGPLGVPVYKEYAQDIYDSGNYLLKVISEILEVSKIETGNRELALTNFKLAKALKSCMIIMATRIEQAKVEVHLDISDDLPELMAEELGIKQVMLNLIGNAIKFTPEGGRVDVTAKVQDSGELYIDVKDTGIGMTKDEIKKAMQPFGKVDTAFSSMKAGTGLGLTIVDSLVSLHGGRLEITSESGRGTLARVVLPAFRVIRQTTPHQSSDSHLKIVK
jgi:PAS domain S-box-containing protein